MIPQEFLDALAVRVLEVWLMQQGFRPAADWDSSDPACVRNHGPYRVWTVQAAVPDGMQVDRETLWRPFSEYMEGRNQLPGAIVFHAYGLERYDTSLGGSYLFASIYQ